MSFFKKNKTQKLGLNSLFFLIITIILIFNIYYFQSSEIDSLWNTFSTSLFFIMILGFGLNYIGKKIPFLNKLGLGFVLCILVPSYLVYSGIINPLISKKINFFYSNENNGMNFPKFFIITVIIGNILNIKLSLLKKFISKIIILSLFSILISCLMTGFLGYLINYKIPEIFKTKSKGSFLDTIFFIFFPLTNGGSNLGINGSINGSYGNIFQKKTELKSILLTPLIILRILSIFFAGFLYSFFDKTKFSGKGHLQKKYKNFYNNPNPKFVNYKNLGTGLLIILGFYSLGNMINEIFIKSGIWLDEIIYIIILTFIVKIFNLISKEHKNYICQISQFMAINFTTPMLALLGLTTDFKILISNISNYKIIFLVFSALLITIICAFFLALLFNLYPLETSLIIGISSYSIGSTGNIGVMSISHRMELLSLAMIISRIIGIFIFIISSFGIIFFYS
ncbi:MAG: 2-hydroxycarboxylate transporter family protein [Candidatus Phytoplasma stylosanthis]|nr:2-hydroxycarboxylate transporter family protein [Candidatus Phytoplasma stylosanthis]